MRSNPVPDLTRDLAELWTLHLRFAAAQRDEEGS